MGGLINIRNAIKDIDGWDACLALILCLSECIVFGNSNDDAPDEALRLGQAVKVLGDTVVDMMTADDDDDGPDDEEPRPSPPPTDLLRKLLERRRATKARQ